MGILTTHPHRLSLGDLKRPALTAPAAGLAHFRLGAVGARLQTDARPNPRRARMLKGGFLAPLSDRSRIYAVPTSIRFPRTTPHQARRACPAATPTMSSVPEPARTFGVPERLPLDF